MGGKVGIELEGQGRGWVKGQSWGRVGRMEPQPGRGVDLPGGGGKRRGKFMSADHFHVLFLWIGAHGWECQSLYDLVSYFDGELALAKQSCKELKRPSAYLLNNTEKWKSLIALLSDSSGIWGAVVF